MQRLDFFVRMPTSRAMTLIFTALCGSISSAATPLTTVRVASGLSAPLYVTHAPIDPHRVFIVEQPGRIRILKDGALLNTPFLNISSLVSYGGEQGLLGLAFHPNYASNGFFYVNYTDTNGNTVVARYQGSGDQADANSEAAEHDCELAQFDARGSQGEHEAERVDTVAQ
jgi:glucose/arabinose dehydrogenase